MSKYIIRETYMELLRRSKKVPAVKVITGMRRCGKTTLMDMYVDELRSKGIGNIYHRKIDIEKKGVAPTYTELIDDVSSKVGLSHNNIVFIDEIQDISQWEKAIGTFFALGMDVYITGSNSDMFSSELSTRLSGRYIEIQVYPLSFAEFKDFRKEVKDTSSDEEMLDRYIRLGSLPAVALMEDDRITDMMIDGTFNTVFIKDVINRNQIRNPALMTNLNRFLMKNIGHRTSVRSASDYLTSSGYRTSPETVDNYISILESALLFYRARRYDSKTKDYLRTYDKFYCSDLGIRNGVVGYNDSDVDGILENIVFLELKRRYGKVDVCDVDGKEVDFIAHTDAGPSYYQVSVDISNETTRKRELRSLLSIMDNYPKQIITWNRYPMKEVDGVSIIPLLEWLRC